jgi:hypothetical protein
MGAARSSRKSERKRSDTAVEGEKKTHAPALVQSRRELNKDDQDLEQHTRAVALLGSTQSRSIDRSASQR